MVRGLPLGGRAAPGERLCTCRRAAVAVCLGNLIAALLVARALYAPISSASAPSLAEVRYSREQLQWVEESIRIRRTAEPVELVEAVKKLHKVLARQAKRRRELPLEPKQKVSYDILQRLRDLGENRNATEQRDVGPSWEVAAARTGKPKEREVKKVANLERYEGGHISNTVDLRVTIGDSAG